MDVTDLGEQQSLPGYAAGMIRRAATGAPPFRVNIRQECCMFDSNVRGNMPELGEPVCLGSKRQ